MRVVTIAAAHARGVHLAPEEGCEFVILLAHLAIGIKQIRFVRNRELVMIEEILAGAEIAGQLRAARVALAAR